MYILLCGFHPFDPFGQSSEAQLITAITQGRYDFNEPEWKDISQEGIRYVVVAPITMDSDTSCI